MNENKKIVIALSGQIASGKDVVKKYIEEKYSAKSVKFSQILRDILNRINVPLERENMQVLSTCLREKFGEDVLAKTIVEDAKKISSDIVIFDGVRRLADIEYAKKMDGFVLIRIDATPEIRYKRAVLRNENVGDAEKTFEQFLKDHETEADKEVPTVMNHAKFSIDNNGTLQELFDQIDVLMKNFVK